MWGHASNRFSIYIFLVLIHIKKYNRLSRIFFHMGKHCGACAAQRAKITEKVHKPPQNHYIEWPVFSDIGLNCESQGEKGRTCKKYKILIGSRVFFFHFIHDLLFSAGHLLESQERFVNLFCNFSPLCRASVGVSPSLPLNLFTLS